MSKAAKKHDQAVHHPHAADSLPNPAAAEMSESDATLTAALTQGDPMVPSAEDSHSYFTAMNGLSSLQQLEELANTATALPPESSDYSAQLQYFSARTGISFLTVTQLFTWAITHQDDFTAIIDELRSIYNRIMELAPTFPKVFSAAHAAGGFGAAPLTLEFHHVFGSNSAQQQLAAAMKERKVAGGMESAKDWFNKIMKYLPAIMQVIAIFAEQDQQS